MNCSCISCAFFDFNDYLRGYGTCEPQDEDFQADHECNLSKSEIFELESLLNKRQFKEE